MDLSMRGKTMKKEIAFLDGEFIDASEAKLPVYDAGIVLGATVTEMIRTFNHKPFKLKEHVERLHRSMKYARFETVIKENQMVDITLEVITSGASSLTAS